MYIWAHSNGLVKGFHTSTWYFRPTQFGGAPEIIIQRPDFRLAAGSTVRRMKQNKDAVWSLVLLLVTGVRSDPK